MIPRKSLSLFILLWLVTPCIATAQSASDLQSQIDANNRQLQSIQAKITGYQKQLDTIGVEKSTLQQAISALTLTQQKLTSQIDATQNKISSANLQIKKLSQSIGDTEETITADQSAVAKSLRVVAQDENSSLVIQIISSHSLSDVWQSTDQLMQFNKALGGDIANLRTAKAALTANRTQVAAAKADLVSLQNDLSSQKKSVNASKKQQQNLLAQTKNKESNYQKLLATAKAELASFTAFTTNAGGSKLLANQTSCDSWGCYYSQRDTLWGNIPLSGTRERLAASGCLVTVMAMILTHYGHRNITPVTINADPGNFSAVGGLLLYTIYADGVSATRISSFIDATLATGNPVVVGVHAYGGTHYVVFTSGSKGKYLMRDPYIANGKDISFSAHYSVRSIFGVSKVIIGT